MSAPGSTQPPIQWVPGALSTEVKRPAPVTESPPSAKAKTEVRYTTSPSYIHGIVRDNVTFTFNFTIFHLGYLHTFCYSPLYRVSIVCYIYRFLYHEQFVRKGCRRWG